MVERLLAIAAGVIAMTFFVSSTQAQGPVSREILWHRPASISFRYVVMLDKETCRDDILDGTIVSGQSEGWEGNICEVREMSTECNGRGFDCQSCKHTMRINASSLSEPPFPADMDSRCYQTAMDVQCGSHSEKRPLLTLLAAGEICVLGDGIVLQGFGWTQMEHDNASVETVATEMRGSVGHTTAPQGRGGLQPQLSLTYDSSGGNGSP